MLRTQKPATRMTPNVRGRCQNLWVEQASVRHWISLNINTTSEYIPLKVTLAIRSTLPRRFSQVFKSKINAILEFLRNSEHGEGKCLGKFRLLDLQPISERWGAVGLRRNNWPSICVFPNLNNLFIFTDSYFLREKPELSLGFLSLKT